ncbi:MAG: flagellar protein FlgN [Rhodanobacter sp.]|nr:MAG: flagellar protein FlgN [Rhodanobacter sp.]
MSQSLRQELHSALTAVVAEMQQCVGQLLQALESERMALDGNDTEALNHAGSQKQQVLLRLERLDTERLQFQKELDTPSTTLESAWSAVMQSLHRCQQLNLRNGTVVNQRLLQVRNALAVLTGHSGESKLYGRTGELRANARSQVLAEA